MAAIEEELKGIYAIELYTYVFTLQSSLVEFIYCSLCNSDDR